MYLNFDYTFDELLFILEVLLFCVLWILISALIVIVYNKINHGYLIIMIKTSNEDVTSYYSLYLYMISNTMV